jgi:hypothetical protein
MRSLRPAFTIRWLLLFILGCALVLRFVEIPPRWLEALGLRTPTSQSVPPVATALLENGTTVEVYVVPCKEVATYSDGSKRESEKLQVCLEFVTRHHSRRGPFRLTVHQLASGQLLWNREIPHDFAIHQLEGSKFALAYVDDGQLCFFDELDAENWDDQGVADGNTQRLLFDTEETEGPYVDVSRFAKLRSGRLRSQSNCSLERIECRDSTWRVFCRVGSAPFTIERGVDKQWRLVDDIQPQLSYPVGQGWLSEQTWMLSGETEYRVQVIPNDEDPASPFAQLAVTRVETRGDLPLETEVWMLQVGDRFMMHGFENKVVSIVPAHGERKGFVTFSSAKEPYFISQNATRECMPD